MPNRIDEQYSRIIDYENHFAKHKIVICHCARNIYYQGGAIIYENTIGDNRLIKAPNGLEVAKRIIFGKPVKNCYGSLATCSQMSRLENYKNVGGFDELFKRSEDTELNIRFAKNGAHFVGINKVLVKQFMTKTNDKKFKNEIFYFKQLIKKHKKLITKKQFNFANKWLDLKYLYFQGKFLKLIKLIIYCFLKYPKYSFFRFYLGLRNFSKNIYFFQFHKNKFKVL